MNLGSTYDEQADRSLICNGQACSYANMYDPNEHIVMYCPKCRWWYHQECLRVGTTLEALIKTKGRALPPYLRYGEEVEGMGELEADKEQPVEELPWAKKYPREIVWHRFSDSEESEKSTSEEEAESELGGEPQVLIEESDKSEDNRHPVESEGEDEGGRTDRTGEGEGREANRSGERAGADEEEGEGSNRGEEGEGEGGAEDEGEEEGDDELVEEEEWTGEEHDIKQEYEADDLNDDEAKAWAAILSMPVQRGWPLLARHTPISFEKIVLAARLTRPRPASIEEWIDEHFQTGYPDVSEADEEIMREYFDRARERGKSRIVYYCPFHHFV